MKIGSKRQITLSKKQCDQLDIHSGDEVECFIVDGHITIAKKKLVVASGLLAKTPRKI